MHTFYIAVLDNKELRIFMNVQKTDFLLLLDSVILLSGKHETILE